MQKGKEVDRLVGANAAQLTKIVGNLASSVPAAAPAAKSAADDGSDWPALQKRLSKLVSYAPVMVFMKGGRSLGRHEPSRPQWRR